MSKVCKKCSSSFNVLLILLASRSLRSCSAPCFIIFFQYPKTRGGLFLVHLILTLCRVMSPEVPYRGDLSRTGHFLSLRRFLLLLKIGVTVIAAFSLCWIPFLTDIEQVLQVVSRLFPVGRGLFEDKVANVWCSLSILFKIKNVLSSQAQLRLCFACTMLGVLPSCIKLTAHPTIRGFKLALVNCALSFFLFSFQVHEKSILLVSLPACLLLSEAPLMATCFLLTSTFSMLPLLQKDGLMMAYVITTLIFLLVSTALLSFHKKTSEDSLRLKPFCSFIRRYIRWFRLRETLVKLLFYSSMLVMAALTVASCSFAPSPALPDLFPVLISAVSCIHFLMFLLYFNILHLWESVDGRNKKKVS
ncbi:hypothetical protein GDO78_014005 [Eleutherodactylus coqui]|uniref:Alpha-1,3-glucosyltransferase n=1 Tax=Eleutherodactylus coqui TaxID=57060 RepID=A0A8J6EQI2_ELECQ|nr:hypothetical protein GDO78_014005 [Eleutherodactylus coqui]